MKFWSRFLLLTTTLMAVSPLIPASAQPAAAANEVPRERLSIDRDWRFAFGHANDRDRDFDAANSFPFNYLAKTGSAVGAASPNFDDRGWRELDLPHDWAVEVPFDERASSSHGSKAIGRNFPERSVGWYRKSFFIPASDLGRRVSLEFDGVFRDSVVWVNGHFLGREESGYTSFAYNVSEYLNYGGENVVVVRVDASLEEGWFYEGAGIYRHVWMVKTGPLHGERHGSFVTSVIKDDAADVTTRVAIVNDGAETASFDIDQSIIDADGSSVAEAHVLQAKLTAGESQEFTSAIVVTKPQLWSLESPNMYKLVTTIRSGDSVVDRYETPFGIRSIRFDPNEGFFLNDKHVRLYGTNNHQDHAGVGAAIPDALQEFRIARLKEFGSNAYRCSHNPPTPELLDACDRLGMLVVDENRSMGTTQTQLGQLERLIRRDRNHPCVVLWSLGNEEWGIEGNEKGERIATTMQTFAQRLDPTRRTTVASSGSWGQGYSIPIDTMGFNYYTHGNTDNFHAEFPDKPSIGTEEGSTFSTRGVYVEDRDQQHLTAYDENKPDWGALAHEGWGHYADRKYVAGLFVWTGFDYRGEPTPFGWPAISSQFGILDSCGFRKDNSFYYEAWWTDKPVLHLLPHWNWQGKEGQQLRVWAHSNCDEVELFLNDKSLGRKKMERNSHLEWSVPYTAGILVAHGYKNGKEILTDRVETTGEPVAVKLTPHRATLDADGQDVSVITVEVVDVEGRHVPTANDEITFGVAGKAKIIGAGNGDPSSHEPDKFLESVDSVAPEWRMLTVDSAENRPEVAFDFDDSAWRTVVGDQGRGDRRRNRNRDASAQAIIYRGTFALPPIAEDSTVSLQLRSPGQDQSPYLNGEPIATFGGGIDASPGDTEQRIDLEPGMLREGKNVLAVVATRSAENRRNRNQRNTGNPAVVRIVSPSPAWKRGLFNGLAQVIVQSTDQPGEITFTASSPGLIPATLKIQSRPNNPPSLVQIGGRVVPE